MTRHDFGSGHLLVGDCVEQMRTLPEASVDAIVTDPPYGLEFMGKAWDGFGTPLGFQTWTEQWAREAFRVLKPGGHILAFGGTRMYHRLAAGIEDAGFEVRDTLMWLYGSGFPKSLDVSKAIDKMDAKDDQRARRHRFTEWIRATGVTAQEINKATGTMMGSHYTTKQSQPAVMTREHLEACRALLGAIPEWVEVECDIRSLESKNYAGREVTGVRDVPIGHAFAGEVYGNTSDSKKVNITAPSTDAAKKWQGWGTALKPAVEPIVLARKPLIGTVAENVMTHGTGALNIDASRIGTSKDIPGSANGKGETFGYMRGWGYKNATMSSHNPNIGRWPANILLDEEAAAMLDEQSGEAGGGFGRMGKLNGGATKWGFDGVGQEVGYGDSGGASRFFYVAKASSAERNNGLDGLPQGSAFDGKNGQLGGNLGSKSGLRANIHPTVKPVDLMAYLIRLVARKDSVILDPFLGSGTTAIAAIQEGVRWIGCEREPDYVEIIQGRISAAQPGLGLNLEQSA